MTRPALCVLAVALAACSPPSPSMPAADPAPTVPAVVGRFSLDLPEPAVWTASVLGYDGTDVTAAPWEGAALDGADRETALDAAGAALQNEVFRRSPPWRLEESGVKTAFLGSRETSLADGRRAIAVLGYPGEYTLDGERRWDVITDGGVALLSTHRASQRPEEDVLRELLDLLSASRSSADAAFGESDWLYAGPVALALPPARGGPGRSERASASFVLPTGTLGMSIDPAAIEIREQSLLERWADVLAAVAGGQAGGVDVETVRSGTRTVAGLSGEELVEITRLRGGGQTERTLTWEHLGDDLEVVIRVDPSTGPLDAALAEWDRILDSVHLR